MQRSGPESSAAAAALDPDWLGLCRRAVAAQAAIFAEVAGIEERTRYEGIGEGGDHTLVIDRRCEDAVFAELEALAARGASFVAISEERGEVEFGSGGELRVVIDPIDGSLNARRTIPSHCLSVAVATGSSMADVDLGFVHDFGSGEEFVARRGGGATVSGAPMSTGEDGDRLEVVGIEAAKPERVLPMAEALRGRVYRLRGIGSIAISLAYVAAGRFDGMLGLRPCRSVDAAAAQLIAREAGASVAFGDLALDGAELGIRERYPVAAAAGPEGLRTLLEAQRTVPG
jgi:myo-inositol-1(or 4)-monophosphatase